MKSRRELISGLLIDLAKAAFIALVVGRIVNPGIVSWHAMIIGVVITVLAIICALIVHPKSTIDKEWKLWK